MKFENSNVAYDEKREFNNRFSGSNRNNDVSALNGIFSLVTATNFNLDLLASSVGIDHTCIRIKLSQPNVDAKDLSYLFESFKLHPERPITIVQNGKRMDPNSVSREGKRWTSTLYIVQFESALEAERALFEKGFTVISGVKTGFLWYDI